MTIKFGFAFLAILLAADALAQKTGQEKFWFLSNGGISWDVTKESRLPHHDNIEMAGQQVAGIVSYAVDDKKRLTISRNIFFPQLRRYLKANDPDHLNYRAYLQDSYRDEILPSIAIGNRRYELGQVDSIHIKGKLTVYHHEVNGIAVTRCFFPSMTERAFVEKWTVVNNSDSVKLLKCGVQRLVQEEYGLLGRYRRLVTADCPDTFNIEPGRAKSFGIYISAALNDESLVGKDFQIAERGRDAFLDTVLNNLVLKTPDSVLNTLFSFSKIRAAESIYRTSMGLVHSPGGGRYYTGIWANDQAEYSGPFFPYLGYSIGNEAAKNAYLMFQKNIPPPGKKMWPSFEMDGKLPCCSRDRGDAAMIANGLTRYLLYLGKPDVAQTFWPLLDWSLSYCDSMKNASGVIASESDELEGRFPSGKANLSTSSLYYGALIDAASLCDAMNKPKRISALYRKRAAALKVAIEKYFGAEVSGLNTYRYYEGNTTLRSWICLPLVMGLNERKEGTLRALFERLWTDNGVLIEEQRDSATKTVFWDRGTLYAFRGAFKAGGTELGLARLKNYSAQRLLGFRSPYVVEAYPEGEMAHLSAESALYCRIFTEGILSIDPVGFDKFVITPQLPSAWDIVELKNVKAFASSFDVRVERVDDRLRIEILQNGKKVQEKVVETGKSLTVRVGK